MMNINFDVYFQKNIGTLYKDNEIDTQGREAKVNLDLNEVSTLIVTFNIGATSITDTVTIKDVNEGLIQIPFKSNVIKQGLNSFEIEALMKNGDVKVSQTYCYHIEKSLENENSVVAETNYPILIQLLSDVQSVKDAELIRISNEQARQVLKDEVLVLKTNLESLQSDLNSLDSAITTNENIRQYNEEVRQTLKANLEILQTNLSTLESSVSNNEDIRESNESNRIIEIANKVKEINAKIIDVENRCAAKESLIDNKIIDVEARTAAKETLVNNKIIEANTTIANVNSLKDSTVSATNNCISKTNEANAKIVDVEARFNLLGTSQQQQSEVLNARTDGLGKTCASLKDAMDSNFNYLNQMKNIVYIDVEG